MSIFSANPLQGNISGSQKSRTGYIDIARGITALLVILGHLVEFDEYLWSCIFAFHMPFFFLASGLCLSERMLSQRIDKFFFYNIKSILILSLFIRLFQYISMNRMAFSTPIEYVLNPYSEWFTPTLFLSRSLFYFYYQAEKRLGGKELRAVFAALVIAGSIFAANYIFDSGFHQKPLWLPMQIDSALIGLAFIIAGYYLRRFDFIAFYHKIKLKDKIFLAICFACVVAFIRFNTYTNVCDIALGRSDLFFFVTACFISAITVLLSVSLELKTNKLCQKLSGLLQLIGRNCLLFYIGHISLFYHLNFLFEDLLKTKVEPMHSFPLYLVAVYSAVSLLVFIPVSYIKEKIQKIAKEHNVPKHFFTLCGIIACLILILIQAKATYP